MNGLVKPRALKHGLLITPRAGELMIFDLPRHLSHRLDRLAARVWELSDGHKTVEEIARAINGTGGGASQAHLLLVLQQLRRARLLGGVALAGLKRLRGAANNGQGDRLASERLQFVQTIDCDVRRRARRHSAARKSRRKRSGTSTVQATRRRAAGAA